MPGFVNTVAELVKVDLEAQVAANAFSRTMTVERTHEPLTDASDGLTEESTLASVFGHTISYERASRVHIQKDVRVDIGLRTLVPNKLVETIDPLFDMAEAVAARYHTAEATVTRVLDGWACVGVEVSPISPEALANSIVLQVVSLTWRKTSK